MLKILKLIVLVIVLHMYSLEPDLIILLWLEVNDVTATERSSSSYGKTHIKKVVFLVVGPLR